MLAKIGLSFGIILASAITALAEDVQNSTLSSIGYPSVKAAMEAVRGKSGVTVSVQSGWVVIDDRAAMAVWSFTPSDHPAYPAAVRRQMVQKDGGWFVNMAVRCEASKTACDKLVTDFQQLNIKMRDELQKKGTR